MPKSPFASENMVKWCPGCGDYAVLKHTQQALAEIGLNPWEVAIVSGIGCSSRLPYYMNTYGFHTVHGRAPTVLTGLVQARKDLTTLMITGDGDGLSIGLGHLLHLIRRDLNTTVILLNNKIYGLTKGQNSPTTQVGMKTKMTPQGHQERSVNLGSLVLDLGGRFYGRCYDTQGALFRRLLKEAIAHEGLSVIEVYQRCPIFNQEAFEGEKEISYQFWPGETIGSENKGLIFKEESWQEGASEPYRPSLLSAWTLLKQEVFTCVGLLWHSPTQESQFSASEHQCALDAVEPYAWDRALKSLSLSSIDSSVKSSK